MAFYFDDERAETADYIEALESKLHKAKDALRWRKYPEEKPEDGRYIFKYLRKHGNKITEENVVFPVDGGYVPFKDSHAIYWLPIPPLEDK